MLRWFHVEPSDPCAIPPGWRFLHDEISGGTSALSKLLVKSSYASSIPIGIPTLVLNPINFCQGIVDFAQIDSSVVSDSIIAYQDQVGSIGLVVNGTVSKRPYNKVANNFSFSGSDQTSGSGQPVFSISTDYAQPMTLMYVGQVDANPLDAVGIMLQLQTGTGATLRQYIVRMNSAGTLNAIIGNSSTGNAINVNSTTTVGTGQKLIIMTYDGSKDVSGVNFYINDMVTPLGKSTVTNALTLTTASIDRILWGGLNDSTFAVNGRNDERHIFNNKLLSQAERETAKEILEQYYTFT